MGPYFTQMLEIGTTLREARMRARIDVSEIEEQTKIRAKYLRALENEEWGLLPGPAYAKSFLRAYAHALGLDGRPLVEEYKERFEHPAESDWGEHHQPIPYVPRRGRMPGRPRMPAPGPSRSRAYVIAGGFLCIVVALLVIGLLNGSSSSSSGGSGRSSARSRPRAADRAHRGPRRAGAGSRAAAGGAGSGATGATAAGSAAAGTVTLTLRPTARIWVCLIGDGHRKLIPGTILLPEQEKPLTYRAHQFTLNLGDNNVEMTLNGRRQQVPASSQAIGYSISAAGLKPLAPGQLPTCA
jgi:cytoskeleton protein RodZ